MHEQHHTPRRYAPSFKFLLYGFDLVVCPGEDTPGPCASALFAYRLHNRISVLPISNTPQIVSESHPCQHHGLSIFCFCILVGHIGDVNFVGHILGDQAIFHAAGLVFTGFIHILCHMDRMTVAALLSANPGPPSFLKDLSWINAVCYNRFTSNLLLTLENNTNSSISDNLSSSKYNQAFTNGGNSH